MKLKEASRFSRGMLLFFEERIVVSAKSGDRLTLIIDSPRSVNSVFDLYFSNRPQFSIEARKFRTMEVHVRSDGAWISDLGIAVENGISHVGRITAVIVRVADLQLTVETRTMTSNREMLGNWLSGDRAGPKI